MREEGSGMKKQGSKQRRLFKICQGSETIKHTITKRLNGVLYKFVLKKRFMEWKRMKEREYERGRTRKGGH